VYITESVASETTWDGYEVWRSYDGDTSTFGVANWVTTTVDQYLSYKVSSSKVHLVVFRIRTSMFDWNNGMQVWVGSSHNDKSTQCSLSTSSFTNAGPHTADCSTSSQGDRYVTFYFPVVSSGTKLPGLSDVNVYGVLSTNGVEVVVTSQASCLLSSSLLGMAFKGARFVAYGMTPDAGDGSLVFRFRATDYAGTTWYLHYSDCNGDNTYRWRITQVPAGTYDSTYCSVFSGYVGSTTPAAPTTLETVGGSECSGASDKSIHVRMLVASLKLESTESCLSNFPSSTTALGKPLSVGSSVFEYEDRWFSSYNGLVYKNSEGWFLYYGACSSTNAKQWRLVQMSPYSQFDSTYCNTGSSVQTEDTTQATAVLPALEMGLIRWSGPSTCIGLVHVYQDTASRRLSEVDADAGQLTELHNSTGGVGGSRGVDKTGPYAR